MAEPRLLSAARLRVGVGGRGGTCWGVCSGQLGEESWPEDKGSFIMMVDTVLVGSERRTQPSSDHKQRTGVGAPAVPGELKGAATDASVRFAPRLLRGEGRRVGVCVLCLRQ